MYQYLGPFGPYFLSSHSIGLCENLLDVNIKFRYSLIIIEHQIDEKTSHFGIKWDSRKSEWRYGPNASPPQ